VLPALIAALDLPEGATPDDVVAAVEMLAVRLEVLEDGHKEMNRRGRGARFEKWDSVSEAIGLGMPITVGVGFVGRDAPDVAVRSMSGHVRPGQVAGTHDVEIEVKVTLRGGR
jgi:hypothetical protein